MQIDVALLPGQRFDAARSVCIVVDVLRAVTAVEDVKQALYRETQLALRAAVGTRELDQLLADKDGVAAELEGTVRGRATALGLELVRIGIKDVILPGEMKDLLNKVTEAKKAAERAEEKRRAEETRKADELKKQGAKLELERQQREAEVARKNAEEARRQAEEEERRQKALGDAELRLKQAQEAYQAEVARATMAKGGGK